MGYGCGGVASSIHHLTPVHPNTPHPGGRVGKGREGAGGRGEKERLLFRSALHGTVQLGQLLVGLRDAVT